MTDPAHVTWQPDSLPPATTPFARALDAFLRDLFASQPILAGAAGFHAVDHRWGDPSEAGRAARLALAERHRAAIAAIPAADLAADEATDRGILLEQIDQLVFADAVLREEAWDPLATVAVLGSGLFAILAREYAPWSHRGAAFLARVAAIPAYLDAARGALTGLPDRPVSLVHLETAIRQLPGIGELIAEGREEADRRAAAGEAPEVAAALATAGPAALAALDAFRDALDTGIRPRAAGEGRLGPALFAEKLRHTLGSDLPPDALLARARADHAAVRAEMLRIARAIWSRWIPAEPLPAAAPGDAAAESAIVARVLDAIAAEHRRPDELIGFCQEEVARIEAFCRDHDLIGLADEPLRIVWTPLFLRAYGRAFLDAPGPLDRGEPSHFFITPPDESAGAEAVESYLREDNDRMLRLLCIHEGVPGHYLQLAWSNRSPSLVRTVFSNGMFAEGWAVYVEQVLLELGYGADDPALMLTHWKFYLRAITNAILDVETHAGSLDEAGALDLMVRLGFQEEDEARAKWLRARLTSTQLSTYYVGALEMLDLEDAARRRAARAVGADPAAVPARRIGPGPGATPGFRVRDHLEAVISHGTPPIRWVGRILEGAAS